MEPAPRLIDVRVPADAVGNVLVLHGGASRGRPMRVSPAQLSVLRMIPIARRIARRGHGELAVFRLLNSRRGWDTQHTPVKDTLWALAELRDRFGAARPTCLVGHSLGGRAALYSADQPVVRGVVALAPWLAADDYPREAEGQRVLIVHGTHDRVASPARAAALAEKLRGRADIRFLSVEGGRHAMLRHHDQFIGPAIEFTLDVLREPDSSQA